MSTDRSNSTMVPKPYNRTASDTKDKDSYSGYPEDPPPEGDMALVPTGQDGPAGALASLVERARRSVHDAVPPNTREAYEGDLQRFVAWCTKIGAPATDPGAIPLYMRHLADLKRKTSTIERALASICASYTQAGRPSPWNAPAVEAMRKALRRELGTRPKKKKLVDDETLCRMLGKVPDNLIGIRDRSLLLTGWCAALRESELVALEVSDMIERVTKGATILVRQSKTDQEGRGDEVPIYHSDLPEHCPVRAWDAWLAASGIVEGPVYRRLGRRLQLGAPLSAEAVCDRVKHYAKLAGYDPRDFGGHSLRSGFISTARRRGKDLDSIAVVTRHRQMQTLVDYIQRASLHERGAGEGLL